MIGLLLEFDDLFLQLGVLCGSCSVALKVDGLVSPASYLAKPACSRVLLLGLLVPGCSLLFWSEDLDLALLEAVAVKRTAHSVAGLQELVLVGLLGVLVDGLYLEVWFLGGRQELDLLVVRLVRHCRLVLGLADQFELVLQLLVDVVVVGIVLK